ncbi:MAG: hypothetical protein HC881_12860 [Leptolyngbyaceae cyanobacterium SL_7_1]|nr:hypothetical protein [Leptolyngbyaceae cyanobacterium SL_7_1]
MTSVAVSRAKQLPSPRIYTAIIHILVRRSIAIVMNAAQWLSEICHQTNPSCTGGL